METYKLPFNDRPYIRCTRFERKEYEQEMREKYGLVKAYVPLPEGRSGYHWQRPNYLPPGAAVTEEQS